MARLLALLALVALAASAQAHILPRAPGNFTLPTLPYDTTKFETSIDNATMVLHWTRHTQTAATRLNEALLTVCQGNKPVALDKISLYSLVSLVGARCRLGRRFVPCITSTACQTAVRNFGGGLWNHGLFFLHNLAPFGEQSFANNASPELTQAIINRWGSFDNFKANFSAAANGVFGSGWAWLVYSPASRKLSIITTPNQDDPVMPLVSGGFRLVPILGLDVWEHAHYLKYQNRKADYVAAFYDVISWKGVSALFARAVQGTTPFLDVLNVGQSIWS